MSHDHDHDHPANLAHHFETPKQQFEAGKLGMWLFLATEVLFFGGLFCGYVVLRGLHPELFQYGSQFLDTTWGAINTAVLILSSLTMAMAVTFAQKGNQGGLIICLLLTLAGAFGFLGIKYVEYSHKLELGYKPGVYLYQLPDVEHAIEVDGWDAKAPINLNTQTEVDLAARKLEPGETGLPADVEVTDIIDAVEPPGGMNFDTLEFKETQQREGRLRILSEHDDHGGHPDHPLQDENRPENPHLFFTIYFMMTGLHGIHVLAGIVVITWLLVRTLKGHFGPDYFTPVDLVGLYWHVVDLVWIFLFPLFYLIH